jgi:CRP-like cAMP-binding protein
VEWQLLRRLTDTDRRAVLSRARRRTFARGEILFHEGDPADSIHFIAEGRVMARRATAAGDSVAFRVIGRGRVLGDVAISSADGRRSSTIVALERTTTLSLSFAEFRELAQVHPGLEHELAVLLAARVKRLSDRLVDALFVPSDRRVVHRLVDLCDEYAGDREGRPGPVLIPLTQTDLAELAGATRPTANRVLRSLASDGLVQLSRGRILVVDAGALRGRVDHLSRLRS